MLRDTTCSSNALENQECELQWWTIENQKSHSKWLLLKSWILTDRWSRLLFYSWSGASWHNVEERWKRPVAAKGAKHLQEHCLQLPLGLPDPPQPSTKQRWVGQDLGSLQCLIPVREVSKQRTCCQFACILKGKHAIVEIMNRLNFTKTTPSNTFSTPSQPPFEEWLHPKSFLPLTRPPPNKSTQGPSASFKGDPGDEEFLRFLSTQVDLVIFVHWL